MSANDQDNPHVNIIDYRLACISMQTIGLNVFSEYSHIAPEVRRGCSSTKHSNVYSLGMLLRSVMYAVQDSPQVFLILSRIAKVATKEKPIKRISLENTVRQLREGWYKCWPPFTALSICRPALSPSPSVSGSLP